MCARCGERSDPALDGDLPLSWSTETAPGPDGPLTRWVCPSCTRRNVRSIEAKLDRDWW